MIAFLALCITGTIPAPAQEAPLPDELIPYPFVANITFPEGPAFDRQGNLYFVNYARNGTIGRMTPDGTVSVWATLPGAYPLGLKVDADGCVYATDLTGKRILRVSPAGEVTTLVDQYQGMPLNGTNDLTFDRAGNLYFTDPEGSNVGREIGAIYRYSTEGQLTRVQTGLAYPNGIVISQDQTKLYVTETSTNRVLVFDLAPDGTLSNKRVFYEFPNYGVDGMSIDQYDRIWVARLTNNTVDVLSPDGDLLASYPVGGTRVTNMAWRNRRLYVTVADQRSIYRFDIGFDGAP